MVETSNCTMIDNVIGQQLVMIPPKTFWVCQREEMRKNAEFWHSPLIWSILVGV